MVTDKKAIEAARDLVISEEAYIAITWKDFTDFCPAPDGLIHVCGKDVQEVLDKNEGCLQWPWNRPESHLHHQQRNPDNEGSDRNNRQSSDG